MREERRSAHRAARATKMKSRHMEGGFAVSLLGTVTLLLLWRDLDWELTAAQVANLTASRVQALYGTTATLAAAIGSQSAANRVAIVTYNHLQNGVKVVFKKEWHSLLIKHPGVLAMHRHQAWLLAFCLVACPLPPRASPCEEAEEFFNNPWTTTPLSLVHN